ncbi:MAG: hypothetical protein AAGD07_06465 [Planctomycetota bacterium]
MKQNASPLSTNPSRHECRSALQKGLGRTRIWSDAGNLDVDELTWACVQDLRYDQQCEDSRFNWLWSILGAGDALERCEPAIWEALTHLTDERSADQLCKLAMMYALSGRERFRKRLFDLVAKKHVEDDLTLGENELIRVAGLDGLVTAVEKRGERLQYQPWDWDDGLLMRDSIEQFGESVVLDFLQTDGSRLTRLFIDQWRFHRQREETELTKASHRERMRSHSLADVLEAAQSDDRCFWLRGWGMHADQPDVDEVLRQIEGSDDPAVQQRLLKVFLRRKLPWISGKLFELCRSEDEQTAFFASRALEGNRDSSIRAFALECLDDGEVDRGIDLLASNFSSGDETLVLERVEIPECPDDRHSILMSCRMFLEANEEADAHLLAEMIYEHTPCSLCRTSGVKLLMRQKQVPEWMLEEVRFDCDEGTRQLFYPQPSQWTG